MYCFACIIIIIIILRTGVADPKKLNHCPIIQAYGKSIIHNELFIKYDVL